jgi:hypothetical protein
MVRFRAAQAEMSAGRVTVVMVGVAITICCGDLTLDDGHRRCNWSGIPL